MKFNLIKGNTLKRVSPLIFCSHDATRSSWEMLRTPAMDCMRRALRAPPDPAASILGARGALPRHTHVSPDVSWLAAGTEAGPAQARSPSSARPSGDLLLSFRDQLAQPPGRDPGLRPSPSPPPAPSTRWASI